MARSRAVGMEKSLMSNPLPDLGLYDDEDSDADDKAPKARPGRIQNTISLPSAHEY